MRIGASESKGTHTRDAWLDGFALGFYDLTRFPARAATHVFRVTASAAASPIDLVPRARVVTTEDGIQFRNTGRLAEDTAADPAISAVEAELRRLFRFEGYRLVAETQVGGIQGTGIRQAVGSAAGEEAFMIQAGVTEVRTGAETVTVTLDVGLGASGVGQILETSVTIPAGHSVVLGTANAPAFTGALILVVRAEIVSPAG